ncbi:MAG TPA: hypothetical protein VGF88_13500 [Acidobacteriaceae bacterium]
MSSADLNRREFSVLLAGAAAKLRTGWKDRNAGDTGTAPEDESAAVSNFPPGNYTPFGYLDNPGHSAVMNRSGVIRSVPPLGFGWWARAMPWPYGEGALREVNYLSLLHLSVRVDGADVFHSQEDFESHGVTIVSGYHTKNLFRYDWQHKGVELRISYVLANPDALLARVEVRNIGHQRSKVTLHATNIYGFPEQRWWGSDGVCTKIPGGCAVSKIWAYGDVFTLTSDREPQSARATMDSAEWERWIRSSEDGSNEGTSGRFPGAARAMLTYDLEVDAGHTEVLMLTVTRGVNQVVSQRHARAALDGAAATIRQRVDDDNRFYKKATVLSGDWPEEWKRGWIYDLETLRMTARPPLGIYRHAWDGMQIFTPRAVLGESMLDAMALSYADMNLAKEVVLGTFADAPAPNVPCSREDGSMNMICADGSEVGTAPTWGMPFRVIRSIYVRSGDREWLTSLYPHARNFLNWWLTNRTDGNGWFHCKCSWESGQDASKRFLVAQENPGAVADFVRTVDVEAAMAEAFLVMAQLCTDAGFAQDKGRWSELARHRVETTRAMFVDGWFRDFDGRDNRPIILKDYYDVMMLYPLAAEIATPEQGRALTHRLDYFAENPKFWLEWPSFMFPYTEAAWNADQRKLAGEVVARTADRAYERTDARKTKSIAPFTSTLPPEYQYRIPGIANEFWALDANNPGGCENYGWGATLPTLILRNVVGFREFEDPTRNAFRLAPALPAKLMKPGAKHEVKNLLLRAAAADVVFEPLDESKMHIRLRVSGRATHVAITGPSGEAIAAAGLKGRETSLEFPAVNGEVYTVTITA